jgi:hypothetical protein
MWLTKCTATSVLKISVEPANETVTMKLEGKIVGPWISECDRAWNGLQETQGSRKLRLDLRNVTFVDDRGTALLRRIHRMSGAEVLADSPLTQYFAERIARTIEGHGTKGASNEGTLRIRPE